MDVGGLCESDGECGTDQYLNNCGGYDVYRRVECFDPTAPSDADNGVMGGMSNSVTMGPILSKTAPESPIITGPALLETSQSVIPPYYPGWNLGLRYCLKDGKHPTYMNNSPVFNFDTAEACCDLHYQDSAALCVAMSMQAAGVVNESVDSVASDGRTSSSSSSSSTVMATPETNNNAPPSNNNSENNTQLTRERSGDVVVRGRVWNDADNDGRRDKSESALGVRGVLVDLFRCADDDTNNAASSKSNTDINDGVWVKGDLTSSNGAFAFRRITPGKYSLKITPPAGYRLANDKSPLRNNRRDSDFDPLTGATECRNLKGGERIVWDAGLVVEEEEAERVAPGASSSTSARPQPRDGQQQQRPLVASSTTSSSSGIASSSSTSGSMHSKSSLRGGSSNNASRPAMSRVSDVVMKIRPTQDATLQSTQENPVYVGGELKVGMESGWEDNILLKFEVDQLRGRDYRSAESVTLRLYALSSSPDGGRVHSTTATSWDEGHVTWSNAPSAGTLLGHIGQTHPGEWIEVDVTSAILSSSEEVTLRIVSDGHSNHSWRTRYASKEGDRGAPELVFVF